MKKYLIGILLLCLEMMGDNFYVFSYRVAMRHGMIINESYNLSRSMMIPKRFIIKASCEVGEPLVDNVSVYYRLKTSKDEMLTCLMRHGIRLRDDTMANNLMSRSTTTLWIPPTPILAREVDGYAVVEILDVKE